jgi:hypothetical protein
MLNNALMAHIACLRIRIINKFAKSLVLKINNQYHEIQKLNFVNHSSNQSHSIVLSVKFVFIRINVTNWTHKMII